MTTLKKFMFDTDFDLEEIEKPVVEPEIEVEEPEEPAVEPVEELPPTFTEEQLAAARAEGFTQGKQEGLSESRNSAEAKLAESLQNLETHIQAIAAQQIATNEQLQNDAVTLSLALVQKVLPTFNEKSALEEVERMVISVVGNLLDIPRIVLKVNESLSEPVSQRIEQHLSLSGFAGELSVVGDSDIAMGDCKVEWASGYAERNIGDLLIELDDIVQRNLDIPVSEPETGAGTAGSQPEDAAPESDVMPELEHTAADTEGPVEEAPATPIAEALEEFSPDDSESPDTIDDGSDPLPDPETTIATDDDAV